jgi:antimicrobial peptide system SdpA family protein
MVVTLGVVLTSLYIVHRLSRPPSPLRLPLESVSFPLETRIYDLIPQGWELFTVDPQRIQPLPFVRVRDDWIYIHRPVSSPGYAFGMRRASAAQDFELLVLLTKIPVSTWSSCTATTLACLRAAPMALSVPNGIKDATLCGDIGIAWLEPRARLWPQISASSTKASRVIRLMVSC